MPPSSSARLAQLANGACPVADLRRNSELIAKASLVVSAPSTLLYQAILVGAPTVVVHIEPPDVPVRRVHRLAAVADPA